MADDQKKHWNKLHQEDKAELGEPTDFAKEVQRIFLERENILEIGCGSGRDSYYFAEQGNNVLATDFSETAVSKNQTRYKHPRLEFQVLDISQKTPFTDTKFSVIYSRLALHYFTNTVTKEIFKELHRILKPSGYLCFICKSTQDPLFGKGDALEKNMFLNNGHVRHFFDEEYVKECLGEKFTITELESGKENFYNSPSAFVKVIARKI